MKAKLKKHLLGLMLKEYRSNLKVLRNALIVKYGIPEKNIYRLMREFKEVLAERISNVEHEKEFTRTLLDLV